MSTVTITREFDATPEQVFAAWTEPAAIGRWYGPNGFAAPEDRITVDLRPGGRWELTMVRQDGNGEFTIGYDILEATAPTLLVMRSDPMPNAPTPTTVRIDVQATDTGTRLTLTDGPMTGPGASGAEAAYQAALDKLDEVLLTGRTD
jgi:uncharacterized protein YndB with AHSA1/START domain